MTTVLFRPYSENRKIGRNTACSYTQKSTCPDACQLKNNGCYADGYPVAFHWHAVGVPEKRKKSHFDWDDFVLQVRALTRGTLFRHNVAGDLPGVSNMIDRTMLSKLVDACHRIQGFTFTHKPVGWGEVGEHPLAMSIRASNTEAVRNANENAKSGNGLTINLSADSIQQADYLASLNIGPVVAVVPTDHPKHSKTPEGRHMIVCPNEMDEKITCDKCKLCAKAGRKVIVAFRAHGAKKRAVSSRIRSENDNNSGRVHLSVMQ